MSDRHEWTDREGRRLEVVTNDGLVYLYERRGIVDVLVEESAATGREILRLAARERLLLDRLGEVAEGLGYDRGVLDAPCNVLGHTVRDMAVNLNAALDRESALAARVKELEVEVEVLRAAAIDKEDLLDRARDLNSDLLAVVAPLEPLFRERFEAWERVQGRGIVDAPHFPKAITLTAEFPVKALRALTKE